MDTFNYFTVSFSYSGEKSGYPDDKIANKNLNDAYSNLTDKIRSCEAIEFVHEYMWPDGSLYLNFRTKLDSPKFGVEIIRISKLAGVGIEYITKVDGHVKQKYKNNKSLEELFDAHSNRK